MALIVELLAGPLVGAAVQDKMGEKNWGNLVIAIDPSLLGQGEFERRAAIVTARVKGAKKAPGVNEILLPGERGDAFAAKVAAKGAIDVEPNLWSGLQELAATYEESSYEASPDQNGAYSTYSFGGAASESVRPKRGAGGPQGWGVATRLVHPAATVEDPFNSRRTRLCTRPRRSGSRVPRERASRLHRAQPHARSTGEADGGAGGDRALRFPAACRRSCRVTRAWCEPASAS